MTEKEYKAKLTQAHTEGYNRGYAKAKQELEKENAELKELLSLVYKGLISYKTNPVNLAVEGTFEMEKSVFMDWLHRVKPFVTEGEVKK